MNDPYKTLKVQKNASEDEIKKAYRTLAKKWHPDRNKDKKAESEFKKISAAYEILSDPTKKSNYDQFGEAEPQRGFGDPFADFFSRSGFGRQQPSRGSDIKVRVVVTLKEAATGVKKKVSFSRQDMCEECQGQGGEGQACSSCNGQGQVRHSHSLGMSIMTCGHCQGSGVKITKSCKSCHGKGLTSNSHSITIDLPAGVDTNDALSEEHQGHKNHSGLPRGHAYFVVEVKQHPEFSRNGTTIACNKTISMADAALGINVKVNTVKDEKVSLKIPAGTQPGQILRIKGKGLPSLRSSGMGDHLVKISIEIPKNLSKQARQQLKEFARIQELSNKK